MSDAKRILLVEGSGRGFLCHYAHALALGLRDLGHDVMLASGRRDELAHWPAPFTKEACLADGPAGWLCLAEKVRAFKPDVVHFQWIGQPLLAAGFLAWLRGRGIGAVYTPHNLLPHRRRWLSTPGFRLVYQSIDRVVARDPHLAWGLEEMLGVGSDRIVHLPGSPNLLAHPEVKGDRAPEIPPRQDGECRLLYFGHGSGRKGLGDLVRALLADRWPKDLHLVVAGEGVLAGAAPPLLASLRGRVRLTVVDRYVQSGEVADLFASADLMVMPYAKQCKSPLTDLAAAFRLPVLRTDRVEAAHFVEGIHGVTVAHGDPAALVSGLRQALDIDTLSRWRAALAREESVEAGIRRLAEGHHRLYDGLTRNRRTAPAPEAELKANHA
ncbi:glycosyltransferase family 4 protein [Magnetospirillum sp. 64-120]|uniref:glycosyltransferase family 4 protein n=1 Tax=Magnetospirillum sp. 64-120 TaxID=1895778 RepID=UPI00092A4B0B|nr:glycosyltransferase family 4 protein [Magnetospirillum sp. 64-120]OJX78609.1 MAG: hypothetical protein BGO92_01840 [Magnetospirillum sp. 64-120]